MLARSRRVITRILVSFCSAILVAGLFLIIYAHSIVLQELNVPEEGLTINVEKGAGVIILNNQLAQQGLIKDSQRMRWWALLARLPSSLQAGSYQVNAGNSYKDVIAKIAAGRQKRYSIIIRPGETFADFYHSLMTHPHLQHTMVNMSASQIMAKLGSEYRHPEGLFYADTYYFYAGEKDFNLLKAANDKLVRVLAEQWSNRTKGLVYEDAYQSLILASIVERETSLASERPLIAGVFHNRLVKGMRLQADPTVIYGMGENFDGNIRRKDLRTPTPYNTYVIYGLPPTPIALVDEQAITAALHPNKTDHLFFVAKGDGSRSHYFTPTWEEHREAVEIYQLKRRPKNGKR